jgi:hypothetical protein
VNDAFLAGFRFPEAQYRIQYFWFLNHRLNRDELVKQMDLMQTSGAGGVILHARTGRITPYMGDEWLDLMADAVQHGSDHGFLTWLYDEDGFPSGFAGGQTLEANPKEYAANFLVLLEEFECEAGKSITVQIPAQKATSELYAAVAVPVKETLTGYAMLNFPASVQILPVTPAQKTLNWTAPEDGNVWLVMIFAREWNPNTANLLNREAMHRFITLTHQKYYDAFERRGLGKCFGSTIPGIFTDEPALMYCLGDKSFRRIVPYTNELELKIASLGSASLVELLPAVFFDVDPATPAFRLRYWNAVGELYQEAYFQQLSTWCTEHEIVLFGHVANEGNFFNQVRDQVDFFKGARYMGFGSSDQLGDVYRAEFETNYPLHLVDNMVTPRLAASAARIYNLPRTSSECFGSAGWAITLERQKTLIDWQVANGVNLFFPHDYSYSIEGHRKGDHPPAFNLCGYFDDIRVLNDYIGRLSYLFSQPAGLGLPRVGVLYGNQTILASMNPGMMQDAFDAHNALPYLVDLLQRLHADFDILPEEYVRSLRAEKGMLRDDRNSYDMIILPAITVLAPETVKALQRLLGVGGTVICLQKSPQQLIEMLLDDPANMMAQDQMKHLEHCTKVVQMKRSTGTEPPVRAFAIQTPQNPIWKNHLGPDLQFLLDRFHALDHRVTSAKGEELGDIVIRRLDLRKPFKEIVVFVANVSLKRFVNVFIQVGQNSAEPRIPRFVHVLDPETGQSHQLENSCWKVLPDQQTQITWSFGPSNSAVFVISPEPWAFPKLSPVTSPILPEFDGKSVVQVISSTDWSVTIPHWNILNMDRWETAYSVVQAGERASYLKRSLSQSFEFDVGSLPKELSIIVDSLSNSGISNIMLDLNGTKVGPLQKGSRLDPEMYETPNITTQLKLGPNILTISHSATLSGDVHAITEPIRMVGSFLATRVKERWVLHAMPASVVPHDFDLRIDGLPHYIWPLTYRFKLALPPLASGAYWLELPKSNAPLCKVRLNGTPLAPVWYGDYRLKLPANFEPEISVEIDMVPYPTNLFESKGEPLGFSNPIIVRKIS